MTTSRVALAGHWGAGSTDTRIMRHGKTRNTQTNKHKLTHKKTLIARCSQAARVPSLQRRPSPMGPFPGGGLAWWGTGRGSFWGWGLRRCPAGVGRAQGGVAGEWAALHRPLNSNLGPNHTWAAQRRGGNGLTRVNKKIDMYETRTLRSNFQELGYHIPRQ